jgi:glycosyltransferase involved in cell wall biosynthesis
MARQEKTETVTVALPYMWDQAGEQAEHFSHQLESLLSESCIARVLLLHSNGRPPLTPAIERHSAKLRFIETSSWFPGSAVEQLLANSDANILLMIPQNCFVEIELAGIRRFLSMAENSAAGLLYSNLRWIRGEDIFEQHLLDYQPGSIRGSFDFGDVLFISKTAAQQVLDKYGAVPASLRWAGLYDLRLKLSTDFPIVRVPEPLYTRRLPDRSGTSTTIEKKKYLDFGKPNSKPYQQEFEVVANEHLRRLGAYLDSTTFPLPAPEGDFPVLASIIMPVRDRLDTIGDALDSALNQRTSFPYNVIVVDDHSVDGTTQFLQKLAQEHSHLVIKTPPEIGLGIGGLLNQAVYAPECGLYVAQLDSDDRYSGSDTLEKLVSKFWETTSADNDFKFHNAPPDYALVIGAYTSVDYKYKEIPPGVIQHTEFTVEQGRNTALRMDGLGAPRAYYSPVLRRFGFPNVSYGEDYAVALRISREYSIGRMFESLYLRRRWTGNTDRSLPLGSIRSVDVQKMLPPGINDVDQFFALIRPLLVPMMSASNNGYNAYKDWLRTMELKARMNLHR